MTDDEEVFDQFGNTILTIDVTQNGLFCIKEALEQFMDCEKHEPFRGIVAMDPKQRADLIRAYAEIYQIIYENVPREENARQQMLNRKRTL
ncbi:hypothetical protein [Falsiphaeobacter marinintestinus]|uniref:hypothetical protein n=1 Tax=Falsiphaeobacter marinintestinus TaxID=1492905 RepID=UPI0011B567F4|nr:hypothetical protein [Phaeobacter marinintestinus]